MLLCPAPNIPMTTVLQGVPQRSPGALLSGRIMKPMTIDARSAGAAAPTVGSWLSFMASRFGERTFNPIGDDSQIGAIGSDYYLGWQEVDSKHANTKLVDFSKVANIALLNERKGLPFLMIATKLRFSWAQNWKVITRDIYQYAWAEVGPEGLPRTTKAFRTTEEGKTRRYKHYFSIPNQSLVDPEYGDDNLAEALEATIQTCLFTIMTETAIAIAQRPAYAAAQSRALLGATARMPYTYYDHYARVTRFWCAAAFEPNHAVSRIRKEMKDGTMTPANCLVMPEGAGNYFADIPASIRPFPAKAIDETQNFFALSQAAKEIAVQPTARFSLENGEELVAVTMPTFRRYRQEPDELSLQPSRRVETFAYATGFPRPSPDHVAHPDGDRIMSVPVADLDERSGRFKLLYLHDGIRRTRHGGWFADDSSTAISPALEGLLARWRRRPDLIDVFNDVQEMVSPDELTTRGKMGIQQATNTRDTVFHRDFPLPFHFSIDADKALRDRLEPCERVGHIIEPYLPTESLAQIARRLAQQSTQGTGKHALQSLFSLTPDQATNVIDGRMLNAGPAPGAGAGPDPDALGTPNLAGNDNDAIRVMATFYSQWSGAGAVVRPFPDGFSARVGDRPAAASLAAPVLGLLPDAAYGDVERSLAARLEQYHAAHPAETQSLIKTMAEKLAVHVDDAGTRAYLANEFLNRLAAANVISDRAPTAQHLKAGEKAVRQFALNEETRANVSRVVPRTDATWSKARALDAAAPAAASVIEDAMDLDAVFPAAGAVTPDDLKNFPFDGTRFVELKRLLPLLTPRELGIFFLLARTPLTAATLARWASMGLTLFNYHATRFAERCYAYDFITLRHSGETCEVLFEPLMGSVTSNGVINSTDFNWEMAHGVRWVDPQGVNALEGIMPGRVIGGYGSAWMKSIRDLEGLLSLDDTDRADGDYFLVPFPVTENNISYPIHALDGRTPSLAEQNTVTAAAKAQCSGYRTLRDMIDQSVLAGYMSRLESVATALYTDGRDVGASPFVELAPTYHFNTATRKHDMYIGGTGPRGKAIMADPEHLHAVLAGTEFVFPSQRPIAADV